MKKAFKFSRNAFGIRIKQTCFVCSHCEMERAINVRKCNEHNKKYHPIPVGPDNDFLIWGIVTWVIKKA